MRRLNSGHDLGRLLCLIALLLIATIARSLASAPWVTLQGGHYLIKRPNDGDTFHVSVEGHEYIFRLYFVDAPKTSAEFRDRVEEQAKYFGVTADQVPEVGDLAKQFTREKLSDSFLVRICWEDGGSSQPDAAVLCFCANTHGRFGRTIGREWSGPRSSRHCQTGRLNISRRGMAEITRLGS